jgi:hypothetical protein
VAVERAHPRYAHTAAITIFVGNRRLGGTTTNVSRGGICADLGDPLLAGAEIEVDIQLVFDEGTQSEALRLPARVAWCTALDESFQVGIAFKPLTGELAEYFTMFLRYLDDGTRTERSKRESTLDKRFG